MEMSRYFWIFCQRSYRHFVYFQHIIFLQPIPISVCVHTDSSLLYCFWWLITVTIRQQFITDRAKKINSRLEMCRIRQARHPRWERRRRWIMMITMMIIIIMIMMMIIIMIGMYVLTKLCDDDLGVHSEWELLFRQLFPRCKENQSCTISWPAFRNFYCKISLVCWSLPCQCWPMLIIIRQRRGVVRCTIGLLKPLLQLLKSAFFASAL